MGSVVKLKCFGYIEKSSINEILKMLQELFINFNK